MNRLVLLFLLGFSQFTFASSDTIYGDMDCKVKSNYVVAMEEGVPKTYSGFKWGLNVGDQLKVKYSLLPHETLGLVTFFLNDVGRDTVILGTGFGVDDLVDNDVVVNFTDKYGTFSIGNDMITLKGGGGDILMKRYYKSDWHGIGHKSIVHSGQMIVMIFTLDCRHGEDSVSAIVSSLHKLDKKE